MTQFNWRAKWAGVTRGGFEVVDVRPNPFSDDEINVVVWTDSFEPYYTDLDGTAGDFSESYDLLPVEQPATRTDTEGRDVPFTIDELRSAAERVVKGYQGVGGYPWDLWRWACDANEVAQAYLNQSDTIASLTAERDGLREALQSIADQLTCRCGEAWTGRRMHDPNCFAYVGDEARDALAAVNESEGA